MIIYRYTEKKEAMFKQTIHAIRVDEYRFTLIPRLPEVENHS